MQDGSYKVVGFGGQPAILTVVMPRASPIPMASVGLGLAAGILPKQEQLPMQMVAAAFEVTSFAISMPVFPFGSQGQVFAVQPVGRAPSITQMNLPGKSFEGFFQDSSA